MRCEQEGNTAYTLSLYFEEQIVIECSVVKCDGSGNRWEVGGGWGGEEVSLQMSPLGVGMLRELVRTLRVGVGKLMAN